MLLELKIKNFKSIKNEVNLSMCKLINKGNKNIIFTKNKKHPKILKSILISGPNSSGKSNIIEALYDINYLIVSSNKFELNRKLKYKPFKLDENTINEPSEFEISLLIDNKIYKYGFSLDENKIYKEYLYLIDYGLRKEIFFRDQQEFRFGINLKEQDTLSKRPNENKP